MDNRSGGIGCFGVLAIVFIVLKLCKLINWSWLWVLAPLWMPFALVLIIALIALIYTKVKGGKS